MAGDMSSTVRVRAAEGSASAAMAFAVMAAVTVFVVSPAVAQVRANAQAEQSLALSGSGPNRVLPPTGRYVSETGENFVFDRSGSRPLFRFERREETWVLRPTPAPRGDIIYRTDTGDQILRVTPEGGMTLYTGRAPNGTPASMSGPASALVRPLMGPIQLTNLMVQRSGLMTRALGGRLVEVNMPDVQSEALSVDALIVATDAVIRMARSATQRQRLARLRSITIVEGGRMSVTFNRGDLRIVINPAQGIGGRPSSARVARAFEPSE